MTSDSTLRAAVEAGAKPTVRFIDGPEQLFFVRDPRTDLPRGVRSRRSAGPSPCTAARSPISLGSVGRFRTLIRPLDIRFAEDSYEVGDPREGPS